MTKVALLVLGAFAAVIFAAFILVALPRASLPGADSVYLQDGPRPYNDAELRGRAIYIQNGCVYCHSQQIRDPAVANDSQRGWGRASYPSDYIHDRPALLGTMRTGPDLINVGARLPDVDWHLLHLYQPRAVVPWSIMPPYPFLFRVVSAASAGEVVVSVPEPYAPSDGVVVAQPAALDLVAYLLSLRRDHPPPELASTTAAPATAPAP